MYSSKKMHENTWLRHLLTAAAKRWNLYV